MLKKLKEKNTKKVLYNKVNFEIKDMHIFFLLIIVSICVVIDLECYLELESSEVISIVGIISTLFFSGATLRLSTKLEKNQSQKEIKNNFSLPNIGSFGVVYTTSRSIIIGITIKDENEKMMYKYRISDFELYINNIKSFEMKHFNNNEWQFFERIINSRESAGDFNKDFGFDVGNIMSYKLEQKEIITLQRKLKKLVDNKNEDSRERVRLDFVLEIENMYQIITKVKVSSYFKCISNTNNEIDFENKFTNLNDYKLSYNEIKD